MVAMLRLLDVCPEPAPCGLDGDQRAGGDRRRTPPGPRCACATGWRWGRSASEGWQPGDFLGPRGMGDPGSPRGVPCGVVAQGKKVDRRHCGTGDRGTAGVWPDPPIAEAASVRSDRQGSIKETWRGLLHRPKIGVTLTGADAHPGPGTACIVLDVPDGPGVRALPRSPDDRTGRLPVNADGPVAGRSRLRAELEHLVVARHRAMTAEPKLPCVRRPSRERGSGPGDAPPRRFGRDQRRQPHECHDAHGNCADT